MKTTSLFFLFFCLLSANLYGQNTITKGIKVGYQRTGFNGSGSTYLDNNGFFLGGLVEFEVNRTISLQGELLFDRKGGSLIFISNSFFRREVDTRLDYISLPILGKLKIIKGIAFEAGPQLGFLINERGVLDGNDFELPESETIELSVNGGFRFTALKHYFIQVRGNLGLTNVYTNFLSNDYKNVSLMLSAGYIF